MNQPTPSNPLFDNINNFKTGLIKAHSSPETFTPLEHQLNNNITTILQNLNQPNISVTEENITWMMQQIGANPDPITTGFVTGRMQINEENNSSLQKANSLQIPIAVPPPFDQTNTDIYHFKLAFLKARSEIKTFTVEEREIDRSISNLLKQLGQISIPLNPQNLTWTIQQLNITTSAALAGFIAGRLLTLQEASETITKADQLLSEISQKYGL
jgi:hypothetical protein